MARRGDTKPLCHVAHASVALLRVSIAHISRDKALVLCQHGSQGTPRACSSRRSRGDPLYLGRAATTGPHTRGEVAVLGRLDMFRTTKEPQSCLTGAPTSMGHPGLDIKVVAMQGDTAIAVRRAGKEGMGTACGAISPKLPV